jgi:hypothetical protein
VAHALFRRLPHDRHGEVAEIFGTTFALYFPRAAAPSCLVNAIAGNELNPDPKSRASSLQKYLWLQEGIADGVLRGIGVLPNTEPVTVDHAIRDQARVNFLWAVSLIEDPRRRLYELSSVLVAGVAWPEAVAAAEALAEQLDSDAPLPWHVLEHMVATHPDRFDRYLDMGLSLPEERRRLDALECLAPFAPPERKATVVVHAVDIVIENPATSDRLGRVLRSVGPLAVDDVVAIAMRLEAIKPAIWRIDALLGLASAADPESKSMVLKMAFDHACAVEGSFRSELLVKVARSCEPPMAGAVLTEALRSAAGETLAPAHGVHQVIATWETIAFIGAEDSVASLGEVVDTASAVGRTYLLVFLCETAPLLRSVFGEDGAAALAVDVERVCRPGKRSAEARRKKEEAPKKRRSSALTVQEGMADYMQQASGACQMVVRHIDDADAARQALKQFRQDLYESDVFEPLDGQFGMESDGTDIRYTPSFVSGIQDADDGITLWFDAQDVLAAWPEVVPRIIDQLRMRLDAAGVQRAEIGWPAP